MVSQSIPLEQLIAQMTDMMFVMNVDTAGEFRYALMNPAAMRSSGLNQYAYGATFQDVVAPDEAAQLYAEYLRAKTLGRPVSFILNHNGQIGESILNLVFSPNGQCTHVLGTVRDITDRYQQEQQLRHQAHRDALTGLLNRRGLENGLNRMFTDAHRSSTFTSVFIVDVDNLKQVNDVYGHIVGDLYLRDVAERIRLAVRMDDLVSRFGGDEFLVVANVVDQLEIPLIAERILEAFEAPWPHRDVVITMSVSIGAATYPLNGTTPWEIIQAADKALYLAKNQGGGRYQFAHQHP